MENRLLQKLFSFVPMWIWHWTQYQMVWGSIPSAGHVN